MRKYRLPLIGFFLALGVLVHVLRGWSDAWPFYLLTGFLLLLHLLFGNVWAAFAELRRGRTEAADKLLRQTYFPELLLPSSRAYYYLCRGLLAMHHRQFAVAQEALERAFELRPSRPQDRALTALNLAHLGYVQKDGEQARHWLELARQEPVNDLLLRDKISELDRALGSGA
jgi:tetratricopeptide (TPR) repeat protein